MAIGGLALSQSTQYRFGSATQMGPGFFPTCLAGLITLLGLGAFLQAMLQKRKDPVGALELMPMLFVLAGVVAFGLLVERSGLVAAVLAVVAISCYDRLLKHPLEVFGIFVFVMAIVIGVFIYLLKLPFDLF